jgi:phosphoserine phosphatase RsbU/P
VASPDEAARGGFRSLTTRLIVWTLVSVGAVYLLTGFVSNGLARGAAIAAAEHEAEGQTAAAVSRIDDVLHSIEERTLALGEALSVLAPTEENAGALLRRFIEGNGDVHGGAIAWNPGTPAERRALYYHRGTQDTAALVPEDLSADSYRYWERDWWTKPIASGVPQWTEPYRDEGGGETWMVTFSVCFGAAGRPPAGVATADVRLRRLEAIVSEIALGRRGFGILLSRSGHVIAASDRERLSPGTPLLAPSSTQGRARLDPIVRRMLAGERGFRRVDVQGEPFWLTFRPLARAGWSLATLYPEGEVLAGVTRLRVAQGLLGFVGLGLLALVVVVLSRRVTRPIAGLAASAAMIARGDLDAPLPPVESRDEVGALAQAFHSMRDSLKEQIRNLEETTAAKERLLGELRVARRIQADMLPSPSAGGPGEGYELGAALAPARAVGGDLYDHFREGSRVFFLAGDVSGKGIAAALFMARAKSVFEAAAAREADPGALLDRVNRGLCRDNEAGMFVTAVAGVLDVASGEMAFALAGHEPPVLVPTAAAPALLSVEGGRVLGLIEASDYPVNRLRLGAGDAVVLYTDGVSEAQDSAGGFFGVDRIVATAAALQQASATELTAGLLRAVRDFAGDAPQSDDITILTLRRLG